MKYTIPIIVVLLGYILFLHSCQIPTIEEKVITTEKHYETIIDSLGKELTYWRDVEPDTVRDTVAVPIPTPIEREGELLNEYTSAYSDSVISARWTQQIAGELRSQEFEYFLKRQQITERTRYITRNIVTERETIITQTIQPRGYISIGGFGGIINEELVYGPSISYTTPNQQTLFFNYDINNQGFTAGIRWKFNLSLNPFK